MQIHAQKPSSLISHPSTPIHTYLHSNPFKCQVPNTSTSTNMRAKNATKKKRVSKRFHPIPNPISSHEKKKARGKRREEKAEKKIQDRIG